MSLPITPRIPRALVLRQFRKPTSFLVNNRHARTFKRTKTSLSAAARNGQVKLQSVRFVNPGLFPTRRIFFRRCLSVVLYGSAAYLYILYLARYFEVEFEILEEEEEEDKDNSAQTQDAKKQIVGPPFYAEEDSTFIPMTWATQLPRTFYRGSDPEWQEFIKIAKDKPRAKAILEDLMNVTLNLSRKHPTSCRLLGKDQEAGKCWLEMTFPDGPPPEYERSGLEIGDGFIAWSQQKVSPEAQHRLSRALWPAAAFNSIWATTKVLMGIQYRRVKQALGLEGKDPFSPEERYRHAMEIMEKQQRSREQKRVGKEQTDPDSNHGVVGSLGSSPSTDRQPPDARRFPWHISVPLPTAASSNNSDIPIAMNVFNRTLSKSWRPSKPEPPRGALIVQGLIEVRGDKGRMVYDVQGFYDPKASKYVFVKLDYRNLVKWKQAPKGGH